MAEFEIRIAKPCNQSWTAMKGDERVRFCGACKTNVFNISEMSRDEVEEMIRKTNGVFCARLYRRTDSRVMMKDCPKGVAAYKRKRVFVLASAGAMIYVGALPLTVMGQSKRHYMGAVRRPHAEPVVRDPEVEPPTLGKLEVIEKDKEGNQKLEFSIRKSSNGAYDAD